MKNAPGVRGHLRRLFVWALALAALGFVAYVVPIRDRCVAPGAAVESPKIPLTRTPEGCVLHRTSGDMVLGAPACAELVCEPGLASTFGRARLPLLFALTLLYLAGTFAWAIRWHELLRLADVKVTVFRAWRVTLEAQAGGVLLPGGIGGDALRIASIVGLGAPLPTVAASVALDRALGLATLSGLAAGLAASFDPAHIGPLVYALAAIPLAIAASLGVLRLGSLRRAKLLEHRLLKDSIRPVLEYLGDPRAPRAILTGLAASLVVSAIQLGLIRGFCTALGDEPTVERWVYTGAALTFVLGIVPSLPGGWGTSDAAFILFLGRAGLSSSTALAVGLLYRANWYLSAAIGAALYVARRGRGS